MMPYHDIIDSFKAAMFGTGIVTNDEIIADGALHRIHVEGDKRGTLNGAYVLHADGNPSGWFQHFKTGVSQRWTLSGKREPMSRAMLQQIEADRQRRKDEQQRAHKEAVRKAQWLWKQAKPLTDQSEHPYLIRKRVQPHRARLSRDSLVIPIYDGAKSNW